VAEAVSADDFCDHMAFGSPTTQTLLASLSPSQLAILKAETHKAVAAIIDRYAKTLLPCSPFFTFFDYMDL
jgi:hypothetical protein